MPCSQCQSTSLPRSSQSISPFVNGRDDGDGDAGEQLASGGSHESLAVILLQRRVVRRLEELGHHAALCSVSEPPAFSSVALRAATQSGSLRKASNDSFAASSLLWASR